MTPEQILTRLDQFQHRLFVKGPNGPTPALAPVLAENLLLIRGLMVNLVDCVANADLEYRHAKAARFDKFIQQTQSNGKPMSKSAAIDALEMESDLIDMKIESERLKNYLKYIDGQCTAIQSVLKFETSSSS